MNNTVSPPVRVVSLVAGIAGAGLLLFLLICILLPADLPVYAAPATTLCVSHDAVSHPECLPTIGRALAVAVSGNTILVYPGQYAENVTLKPGVPIVSDQGPKVTTIIGDGSRGVIHAWDAAIQRDTRLEGFTITGGNNPFFGGGIDIRGASPTISNTIITGNQALNGGGVAVYYAADATVFPLPLIINSTISSNTGAKTGGGIEIRGVKANAEIVHTLIIDNNGGQQGGGVRTFSGNVTVKDSVITGNSATANGGGIYLLCTNTELAVEANHTRIENNRGGAGAGLMSNRVQIF